MLCFYIPLFYVLTYFMLEYFYNIYKESKYYKEDVVNISYVGDSFVPKETDDKLKIKDL
jgi:hypothetical protein